MCTLIILKFVFVLIFGINVYFELGLRAFNFVPMPNRVIWSLSILEFMQFFINKVLVVQH